MTGAQLAGWLRALAEEVQPLQRVDGKPYRSGPVQVQVATPSGIRTWKQRHGSLDPPSVSDPSHEVIRETIRDAFETHLETILRRIRDASETPGSASAASTFLSKDLKNTADSEPVRSERAPETDPAAAAAPAAFDSEAETLLSLDFALHETAVDDCVERYKVSREAILQAVEEFKVYWTVGGGTGQRRSHWQLRCRQDLKRKWESNRLSNGVHKVVRGQADERVPSAKERFALLRAEQGR